MNKNVMRKMGVMAIVGATVCVTTACTGAAGFDTTESVVADFNSEENNMNGSYVVESDASGSASEGAGASDLSLTQEEDLTELYEMAEGEIFNLTNLTYISLKAQDEEHWNLPYDIEVPVVDYEYREQLTERENGFYRNWRSDENIKNADDYITISTSMGSEKYPYDNPEDMMEHWFSTSWNLNDYYEENVIDNGEYTLYYCIRLSGKFMSNTKACFYLRNNASLESAPEEFLFIELSVNKSFHCEKGEDILNYYHEVKDSILKAMGTEDTDTVYYRGLLEPHADAAYAPEFAPAGVPYTFRDIWPEVFTK